MIATLILLAVTGVALLGFAYSESLFEPVVLNGNRVAVPQSSPNRPAPNPNRNAYFGELHLHTSYSMDANLFGTGIDPRTAYRFARGETVTLPSGLEQQITAPLDFVAVTDHAESLGSYLQCGSGDSGTYWSIECISVRHKILPIFPRLFRYNLQEGPQTGSYNPGMCGESGALCIDAARSVWQEVQNAANEAYVPGEFTTFIGFEYSPTLDQGGMLHRNVIFGGSTVPATVFTAYDGVAEDLLRWLDSSCAGDCAAITIPHNPNFSWGLMFGDRNSDGTPVTRSSLELRARYEKLVEIFQAKGSSECAAGLGNNDEQCGFENLFPVCVQGEDAPDDMGLHARRCVAVSDMLRNVLRKGLVEAGQFGFNPRKFGIVAGTDNHNGTPGDTNERTYKGHAASNDDTPEKRLDLDTTIVAQSLGFPVSRVNPGGLTGVWADENTRESIFDALQRKETFGTSGTRIHLRLFAGYDLPIDLHQRPDYAAVAYASGVPMGGDLASANGRVPSFVVQALRDPDSAPLDRIQIVKGWAVAGESHERVYDVACADGRQPDPLLHRCAKINVDADDCNTTSGQGAATLAKSWHDPDFEPNQRAFYYARVLEVPTCRYTTYDARTSGASLPEGVAPTIQERAWSSPVWYTPQALDSMPVEPT